MQRIKCGIGDLISAYLFVLDCNGTKKAIIRLKNPTINSTKFKKSWTDWWEFGWWQNNSGGATLKPDQDHFFGLLETW